MTSTNKVTGFVIALIGGGLGLLAFFVLPFTAAYNYTSQYLASTAVQYIQQSSNYGSSVGTVAAFALLWLAPVFAGLIALIAVFQFRSSATVAAKQTAGGWLIALAILGLVLYIGLIIYIYAQAASISSQASLNLSALGSGYWIYLVAMVGAIVGGAMARSGSAQVGAFPPPPPVTYTQYQQPSSPQYPPYQQPPSPQYPPYQQPSSPQYPSYQQPSSPQYPRPQRSSEGQQWPSNQ